VAQAVVYLLCTCLLPEFKPQLTKKRKKFFSDDFSSETMRVRREWTDINILAKYKKGKLKFCIQRYFPQIKAFYLHFHANKS
jgi:hypothetical protein